MKKSKLTVLLLYFLMFHFTSCDFAVKDKESNTIKVDYDEDNSLLEDEKLDKLLEEHTASLESFQDQFEEKGVSEQQKQEMIRRLKKTRSIAKEITSYIENYKHEDIADNCRESIEKLKQGDAKLDVFIQEFININDLKVLREMEANSFIMPGMGLDFLEYGTLAVNARIECSFSIDIFK